MKHNRYGLFAVLLCIGCGQEPPAPQAVIRPVIAMQVGNATQFEAGGFPGKAKAHEEVELAFRVDGPLIARPINVGDEVKKGDLIARIDPRDFEVRLRDVRGQIERAQAQLTRAQADYDRVQRIYKEDPGATSEAAIDMAREQRDQSRANIRSFQAAVDASRDQLRYTFLTAPRDGTIVRTYVENFDNVQAKQPIARLLNTSRIEMTVDIPEGLISSLPYVKNVRVRLDAFPDREIPAEIWEVGREASQTTRTYPVTVIMDQPDDITILPGMAGEARGEVESPDASAQTSIEVPLTAVFSPTGTEARYVWVIDAATQTAQQRAVTTGELTARGIMITDGLQPGEWVATVGASSLREGQQVRIQGQALGQESGQASEQAS